MRFFSDRFGNKDESKNVVQNTGDVFGVEADETGTGSTLGLDVFCDTMSDLNVSADEKITPDPNITGIWLPSVHCNLSWLDVRGRRPPLARCVEICARRGHLDASRAPLAL